VDPPGKTLQLPTLPFLPAQGRFNHPILDLLEELWPVRAKPGENIEGQLAIMRARLDQLNGRGRFCRQPIRELAAQQSPKQGPGADAGIEVPPPADGHAFALVVSKIWTVESQFHEVRQGDAPRSLHSLAENCHGFSHSVVTPTRFGNGFA
jgi:hypothetical protein